VVGKGSLGKEARKSLGTVRLHSPYAMVFKRKKYKCFKSKSALFFQEKVRTRMVNQDNSDTGRSWSDVWGSPPRDQNNGNANRLSDLRSTLVTL